MDGRRSSKKDSTDTPPTIAEVLSAVDSLRNDLNKRLDEIEKHLSAIDDRVNKLSNRISAIDDIEKSLTSIDEQVSDLSQRVQAVELKCTSTNNTTDEIAVVKQDLNKARRAINDNEQYSRRNNVRIKGLPVLNGNCQQTVVNFIRSQLHVNIQDTDIDIAHQLPVRKQQTRENGSPKTTSSHTPGTTQLQEPVVIVKFRYRSIRDDVLRA